MPKTKLGEKVAGWSTSAKDEFRTDLEKLTKVPADVLRAIVDKIAKTYPACNTVELAALEAEQHGVPDSQALSDFIAAFVYLWDNIDGEQIESVTADLSSLGLISSATARSLNALLVSAEPFRESAKVAANYLRLGSALFVTLRGTVDLRLRFHETEDELLASKMPTELVSSQPVIVANLTISEPDGEERVVSFLMDDSDLKYMKRFVRNIERELELSKGLLKDPGA